MSRAKTLASILLAVGMVTLLLLPGTTTVAAKVTTEDIRTAIRPAVTNGNTDEAQDLLEKVKANELTERFKLRGHRSSIQTFGTENRDHGASAISTSDGGSIIAGYTYTGIFGDGNTNALVAKTDAKGNKLWEYQYGGSDDDAAYGVAETLKGTYLIVGFTKSAPGLGREKGWIIEINPNGSIAGEKSLTGLKPTDYSSNGLKSIEQTLDGGFILSGYTTSHGGLDIQVQVQAWVLRLDKDGNEVWSYGYGSNGGYSYNAVAAEQTSDGGYLVSITSNHPVSWILRLTSDGKEISWKEFKEKGMLNVAIMDVEPISDGYIITGHQRSSLALIWIAKVDLSDNTVWSKTYGENDAHNMAFSIQQTQSGYVVAGSRSPSDGSSQQGLLLEIDKNGKEKERHILSEPGASNFQSIEETDGEYTIAGSLQPPGKSSDALLVKTNARFRI